VVVVVEGREEPMQGNAVKEGELDWLYNSVKVVVVLVVLLTECDVKIYV